MKNIIKIVAICLALVQLFTGVVFGTEVKSKEDFLKHIGVIDVYENYNTYDYISRIEFVETVLKMKKIDAESIVMDGVEPFYDVTPEDDIFDVAVAGYQLGLVKGGTDGCFRPYANISQDEAVIIILRALGAGDMLDYVDGAYPLARKLGLYDNLGVNKTSGITRKDAMILVYNAMKAEAIEKKIDGTVEISPNGSILGEFYNLKYKTAVIEGNYRTTLYGEDLPEYNTLIIGGEMYNVTDPQYNEMIGVRVVVYYNENGSGHKNAVYVEEVKTSSYEMALENVYTLNDEEIEWENSDNGRALNKKISPECITIYNNSRIKRTDGFKLPLNGKLKALDNNNDTLIDVIIVTAFDAYKVESVSSSYNRISLKGINTIIELNDYEKFRVVNVDGEEIALSTIKEDDIAEIYISPDKKYIDIIIVGEQISGTVTKIKTDNNRNYKIFTFDDGTQIRTMVGYTEKINIGSNYVFLLDSRGYICATSDILKADVYKLAVVMGIAFSDGMETDVKVKLYGTDEKVYMLTIPKKVKCLNYGSKVSNESAANLMLESEVIRYSAKDEVLTSFEYASDDESYDGLCRFAILPDGDGTDNQYWRTAALIGGKIPVDSNTVIITYNAEDKNNEREYSFGAMGGLTNEAYYPGSVAYRVGNNDIYADVVVTSRDVGGTLTKDSPVMLVSEISEIYDEESGDIQISVKGFVANAEKEFVLYDSNLINYQTDSGETITVSEGDCIRYVLNSRNEIKNFILMYDYDEEKLCATDGGTAYGGRINYRIGRISAVHGNYLNLILDGKSEKDEYLYTLNNAGLYQVSEINGETLCEVIKAEDLVSLKNNPDLKDKVFAYLVYANTKMLVVYKK